MPLELITTLSNVITLLILVGGVVAATVQFRHVRTSNELAAVLAIDRSFAEPDLQGALTYVQDRLPEKLAQAPYRSELAARGYVDPVTHPEMAVCNWFNETGTMVAGDFLDEDLFFDSYGRLVDYYWRLLEPAIALLRRERGPDQYASFEDLARRAERWRDNHRAGIYSRAGRMPITDPWADIDRARAQVSG
jgi:hypothetical protein